MVNLSHPTTHVNVTTLILVRHCRGQRDEVAADELPDGNEHEDEECGN
jgi:hypothetical protein